MMENANIEVKARYANGQVYFEEMPSLTELEFEFIAQIPQQYVEKTKQEAIPNLEHLPACFAQEILEQMASEREEYDQIMQMTIAADAPRLSEKHKQYMEAFALYDKCK